MNKLIVSSMLALSLSSCTIPPTAYALCTNSYNIPYKTVIDENMTYNVIMNCRRRWSEKYTLTEPSFFNLKAYLG